MLYINCYIYFITVFIIYLKLRTRVDYLKLFKNRLFKICIIEPESDPKSFQNNVNFILFLMIEDNRRFNSYPNIKLLFLVTSSIEKS